MKTMYTKMVILFLMSLNFGFISNAQQTIIIQPDNTSGKDAYLRSLSPDENYGTHPDLSAHAWTNNGNEVIVRGIIDFDLSDIPNDATINSARLSLYSYNSPANGPHSKRTGSNKSILCRVTTSWDENTVTWNNQPSFTTHNQVYLSASTDSIQDYINIDVTNLVEDMINDPINSHGFLFKQVTEEYYRKMLFASSDNQDITLHPKLEITYTEAVYFDRCLTITPSGINGKDAYLRSLSPDENYGTHPDLSAHAWTNNGNEVVVRGIIDFDLSDIPSGATINSASLSLYSYNSPANGAHSNQSGSNESVLSRVTTSWDENTVTWNNQPSSTTQNQVFLSASTDSIQDYLDIDVTDLVEDMINDPINSHGFLFKQVNEEYYSKMLFASSDNPDITLHPNLQVCYSSTTSILENNNTDFELKVFPNPASNYFTIDLSSVNKKVISIDIINSSGQIIESKSNIQSNIVIDASNYIKGLYFIQIHFNDFVSTKKIIIK